jgi:hypothetical protein
MKSLEHESMAGAWRCLCLNMMIHSIQRLEWESKLHKPGCIYRLDGNGGLDKEVLHQRTSAKRWLEGGVGTITFEDCCEALGLEPDYVRRGIEDFCYRMKRKPQMLKRGYFRGRPGYDPDELELSVLS